MTLKFLISATQWFFQPIYIAFYGVLAFFLNIEKLSVVKGIASSVATQCNAFDYPGLFTGVANLRNWIERKSQYYER